MQHLLDLIMIAYCNQNGDMFHANRLNAIKCLIVTRKLIHSITPTCFVPLFLKLLATKK